MAYLDYFDQECLLPPFESVEQNERHHHAKYEKMQRDWLNHQPNQQKVYYNLCLIKYFLNVINPANDLKQKLVELFRQYPSIDLIAMGFTDGWDLEPLWKE